MLLSATVVQRHWKANKCEVTILCSWCNFVVLFEQPGFRKNLGLLEKKKDYKLRAEWVDSFLRNAFYAYRLWIPNHKSFKNEQKWFRNKFCNELTLFVCFFYLFYSDYHKKQNTLAALRKKALEKNPDEFYFNMISSQLQVKSAAAASERILLQTINWREKMQLPMSVLSCTSSSGVSCVYANCCVSHWQDGVHVAKKAKQEEEVTEEQKRVMRTQDIKYVEMKRVAEAKVSLLSL